MKSSRLPHRATRRLSPRLLGVVLSCVASAMLAGCHVPAVLAYKLGMEPPIPAEYTPPQVPLLVLVENYRSPAANSLESDQLARFISEELERNEVVPVVAQEKLESMQQAQGEKYRAMSIPQVGAAVGAQQVLYVDVVHWSMTDLQGSDMARGSATVYVRIVDVASGATVWPSDSAGGRPVSYETPYGSAAAGVTATDLRMRILRILADRTAKLFYPWRQEGVGQDR